MPTVEILKKRVGSNGNYTMRLYMEDLKMEKRCPYCGSDDVIEWGDGFICRDCGEEFGSIILMQDLM